MKLKNHISFATLLLAASLVVLSSCSKNELDGMKDTNNGVEFVTGDDDTKRPFSGALDLRDGDLIGDGGDGGGGGGDGSDLGIGDNEDLGSSGSTGDKTKITTSE